MSKMNGTVVAAAPVERTSAGLRNALFDELDHLRSGESNPAKANAVAKLADQVINTVRLEVDVQKHLLKHPPKNEVPTLGAPITLGSAS